MRVGIKPPKGVLLYGPPGTGKTLLARAVASSLDTNFLKVVSSAIVDKYIGESARLIREMFGYAKDHEPCIIFMDEIDAIGGRRFSEGTSADREIQRTLVGKTSGTEADHLGNLIRGLAPMECILQNLHYRPWVRLRAIPYFSRVAEQATSD